MPINEFAAFGEAERAGWSNPERATGYVDLFASAADQVIENLLIGANAQQGDRVLDLCCGQGNVTQALQERGCDVAGLDFSPAMLARARSRVPLARFFEGDAQDLPFSAGDFDVVVSNFGVCHVPDQPRVLSEVHRVLRPGGCFAMTVWCGPDVSPCFQTIYGAVQTHGSPDVNVPPGPDFHQFANRELAETLFRVAGFDGFDLTVVDCAWELDRPEGLFEIFEHGTVRAALLLANQPPENLAAIRASVTSSAKKRFASGQGWRVPVPAALVTGVR